ncbi:MAG: PepSY domain-containing protein [Alphaproteobacteria bacterium]|nr:PepSY domain-containing protein [Alphaproteobacteria bacterium]
MGAAGLCLVAACQPDSEKTNPAVATEESRVEREETAPAAGANSFTMDQAQERLTNAGYTGVTGLTQDASGVWRGTGMKDGSSMSVMVDYQGNVTAQMPQ